jgi:2'-5' RNA ligase
VALALEMGLDPRADRAIRDLWSRLEQLGVPSLERHVPSIRPHLSLTVTDDADGLREHAPGLALSGVETEIEMAAVSLFPADPPVLVLAVAPAPQLVALHERVSATLAAAGVDIWPHYRPGTWLPHCSLSMGVPADALAEALSACLASPLPLRARLRAAALTDSVTGATTPL